MSAGRGRIVSRQPLLSCTATPHQIHSHSLQIHTQWHYNKQLAEVVVLMSRFRAHNIRAASEYQRTSSLSSLHSGCPSRGSSRIPPLPGHHPAQCNQGGAHCRGQDPAHRGQSFRHRWQQGADRGLPVLSHPKGLLVLLLEALLVPPQLQKSVLQLLHSQVVRLHSQLALPRSNQVKVWLLFLVLSVCTSIVCCTLLAVCSMLTSLDV